MSNEHQHHGVTAQRASRHPPTQATASAASDSYTRALSCKAAFFSIKPYNVEFPVGRLACEGMVAHERGGASKDACTSAKP